MVELEVLVETVRHDAHVNHGAGPETVLLVEGEFFARAHTFMEVDDLLRRIGQGGEFLVEIWDVGAEVFEDFPFRPFDVGGVFVFVFAIEDDLATISVGELDATPGADGITVLRIGIDLDRDRCLVVFVENVLHGIEVMLPHVAEATAIIVPVATEGAVSAMGIVRFHRRWAKPHIVVELWWHVLFRKIGFTDPEEFPVETGDTGDGDLERPAKQVVHDGFFDLFHRHAHAVEAIFEAEPGIESEDAVVLFHSLYHRHALADRAAHGLLAPNVFAGLGSLDGHESMPVRRCRDVNDIDVFAGEHFAEIFIALDAVLFGFGIVHALS